MSACAAFAAGPFRHRVRARAAGRFLLVFLSMLLIVLPGCNRTDEQRRASIYDLKADPTEENVALIREMLADGNRDIRATALNALLQIDVDDASALARAGLEDPDGFVRATAAKLLGDLAGPEGIDPLIACLDRDPDPVARQRAAESLGLLGGLPALAALVRGLSDPVETVRLAAVDSLRRVDPAFDVVALARALAEDDSWEVRARAAHALGRSGDPAVESALDAALGDPNEFVRSAAQNALRVLRGASDGGS